MNTKILSLLSLLALALPASASAQTYQLQAAVAGAPFALLFGVFIVLSLMLTRVWTGIMNVSMIDGESLASIEKRQPYLPSFTVIISSIFFTAGLLALSLSTVGGIAPFNGEDGWKWGTSIFLFFGIASFVAFKKWPKTAHTYLFAGVFGTVLTFILIGFQKSLFSGGSEDPFLLSLGLVCTIIAWRFLFGPWTPKIKVTILSTFLLWVGIHLIFREAPSDRLPYLIALGAALVPAIVWCWLFLEYHRQRWSLVFLMFFSGMLSTAPILFYDALVRHGVELDFFLFKIIPQSFTRSSNAFVSGNILEMSMLKSNILAALIAFILVGLIEEISKFWVLKKSGQRECTSIDDVMQLGIIVAIGFAFAENILNPTYFTSFVRDYLIAPDTPNWSGFMGNILGRSILTNMVHIVSTGILAYFFGIALFARSYLADGRMLGKHFYVPRFLHHFFNLPEKEIFRREMMTIGFLLAICLHGAFNFMVTLPDLLPNEPRTIGALLGLPPESFLHYIAILVIPSLVYVVGGLWVLSILFYKKENMKERGKLIATESLVRDNMWIPPVTQSGQS